MPAHAKVHTHVIYAVSYVVALSSVGLLCDWCAPIGGEGGATLVRSGDATAKLNQSSEDITEDNAPSNERSCRRDEL